MNHAGCKAIGLLAFWGGITGGIYPLPLAQAQTTGVRYGNYVTVTTTEAAAISNSTLGQKQLEPVPLDSPVLPEPPSPFPRDSLSQSESVEPESTTAQETSSSDLKPAVGSYFGIGGTLGLSDGETALGSGGFSLMSKGALSEYITLHNATSFGKQTASMFALTGEFPIRNNETQEVVAMPFLGGGTLVTTQDGWRFHGLVVGGIDVPLSRDFMGTLRVNTGFVDGKTEVGVVLGVGYRFNLFNLF
ncbi:hypothetical protein PMG71_11475 [Roseofilum sp. BLCC_M154]|uniref:Outer membrane protein beta-barrel domain-containing protein n=1 Tax=Roseofilum acuticapitatum BLCC-M154 TaxID=3022444 RepID=A0ABT7AVF6_9CYAN|nr:hypothetical protein [Roseofilum acuticapitatum]MDJ1170048.1 hypothetical protein [Roseofilum acuticapitatum BLCC-M154]